MITPDTNDVIVNENDDINRGLSIKSPEKMENTKNIPEEQEKDEFEEQRDHNKKPIKSKRKVRNYSKIKKKYTNSKNNMAFLKLLSKQNLLKENNANMKIQQVFFSPYAPKIDKKKIGRASCRERV